MLAPKALHPLLLEPTYWRIRLQELQPERQQLLFTPRPDLSTRERDVVEFRLRAHDGARLWGLFARPITDPGGWNRVGGPWRGALGRPARIRRVGPAERPEIDGAVLERGCAEFVFQEPAGRRLEDRVLDVVRICRVAFETKGIDRSQVTFSCPAEDREPDEFVIAQHLFAGKFC